MTFYTSIGSGLGGYPYHLGPVVCIQCCYHQLLKSRIKATHSFRITQNNIAYRNAMHIHKLYDALFY